MELSPRTVVRIVVALTLGTAACGSSGESDTATEDSSAPVTTPPGGDAGKDASGLRAAPVDCRKQPDGTPCGEPGGGKHCVIEACVLNACGDGIRAEAEECDDGNERDRDGCNARCVIDMPPDAGRDASADGGMDAGGSNDSGTDAGVDATTDGGNAGGGNEAGPQVEAGPEAGGGSEAGQDSGSDASATPDTGVTWDGAVSAACSACREKNCREFQGIDLVAGCLERVDPEQSPDAVGDPNFIQQCIDVITCARYTNCAYSAQFGPAQCYCGANAPDGGTSVDDCVSVGPAANAPCLKQWQAAARTTLNGEVHPRLSDVAYPAGWAYFLLQCDLMYCSTPEAGNCTVP